MNQDVDQVIAKHRVSPEFVLNPKDRIQKWMVLARGLRLGPEMGKTTERTELDRIGEIHDVVKNGLPIPGWLVSTKGHSKQSCAEKPVPGGTRVGSFAALNCFLLRSVDSHCCSLVDD
ncbi:MAG: hypothetical protein QOJ36_330 [Verrucomicrobiota bacterium]